MCCLFPVTGQCWFLPKQSCRPQKFGNGIERTSCRTCLFKCFMMQLRYQSVRTSATLRLDACCSVQRPWKRRSRKPWNLRVNAVKACKMQCKSWINIMVAIDSPRDSRIGPIWEAEKSASSCSVAKSLSKSSYFLSLRAILYNRPKR